MNSYIQKNKKGKEKLVVYYNNALADYDNEQTELALKRHGLPKNTKINILCLPHKKGHFRH